jgi:Sulfotransferase family
VRRKGEPQRYFFMHIPKTAGSTLFRRLIRHHGDALYPLPFDRGNVDAAIDVDYMEDRFRSFGEQIRVIVGHFPLCLGERLGVPLTTFTVLRDPVERTLSFLRKRQLEDGQYQGWPLEDLYADPYLLHGLIHNYMVKALTLTVDEMRDGVRTMVPYDEARLAQAKHNLVHRIEMFGLQEDFEDFCGQLAERFGWDLGDSEVVANRTAPVETSREFRERIAYDNAFDVKLYNFAKDALTRGPLRAAPVSSS